MFIVKSYQTAWYIFAYFAGGLPCTPNQVVFRKIEKIVKFSGGIVTSIANNMTDAHAVTERQ